ncbi:MAG TPA: FAD-binding protein, partial [Armatimonadota bacterium]|nr:FAD-binding protein [Armatimonadota bacterium]
MEPVGHIRCDVVVMGVGAAGLAAAHAAARAGANVWVISKMHYRAPSPTTRAYGDITWSTEDTAGELVRQMALTGGLLGNQRLLEVLAADLPRRLADLRGIGVAFDEPRPAGEGMPGLMRWSYRGQDGGQGLVDVMQSAAEDAGAGLMWGKVATQVLVQDGRVVGLAYVCLKTLEVTVVAVPAVIIATGGGAGIFARTDSPPGNTGDGIALAYRAGAELVDLECVSFVFPPHRVCEVLAAPSAPHEPLLEV